MCFQSPSMKGGLGHSLSGLELSPGCAFCLGSTQSVPWLPHYFRKKQPSKPTIFSCLSDPVLTSFCLPQCHSWQSLPRVLLPRDLGPLNWGWLLVWMCSLGWGWREGGRMVETGVASPVLLSLSSHTSSSRVKLKVLP